ncbi:MAG: nucleotidyltransferase domain-containing protein [Caldilineaceae bacterium]
MNVQVAKQRQSLLERELNRYVQILAEEENPEKVIVFGSVASGEIKEWSDIDLVVVAHTNLPFLKRIRQLRHLLQPKVSVDILCYTPDEFSQLRQERLFFQEEIVGKGKVLYERSN